jgi:hypothetical protein
MPLRAQLCLLSTVYLFSRLIFHGYFGVAFDPSTLHGFWQFLPVECLKTQLLSNLFHLHSQPPLFNLLLGIGETFFPRPETFFFVVQHLLGILNCSLVLAILNATGLNWKVALGATALYLFNPSHVLYENWLFYPLLESTTLLLGMYACLKIQNRSVWPVALFSFSLSVLSFTRALFTPLWLLFSIAIVYRHIRSRKIILLIPLLLNVLLMTKNYFLVGQFSTSSWTGMNLLKVASYGIGHSELMSMARQGVISYYSVPGPFQGLRAYPSAKGNILAPTGIAALDMEVKSSGEPNFNNQQYPSISEFQKRDAMELIKTRPWNYTNSVLTGIGIYLQPASYNPDFFGRNLARISQIDRLYNFFLFPFGSSFLFAIILLTIVVSHISCAAGNQSPYALACGFLAGTFLYHFLVSNLFEIFENNRFRYALDGTLYCSFFIVLRLHSAAITTGLRSLLSKLRFRAS